ncbi:MAG TPA: hypothetical protein VG458_07790 [Solirubrobacterales bacterium]|nr:hypothetical protein [Solirubrobacterales bacterium]
MDFIVMTKPAATAAPDTVIGVVYGKKADEGEAAIRELAAEPGIYIAVPLSKAVELAAEPGGLSFGEVPVEEPEAESKPPKPKG